MNPHRITITGDYSLTEEQLARVREEGFEVRGLMARRSEEPVVVIHADVVLPTGRTISARAHVAGCGELMRWWSATLERVSGAWETVRRESLSYRPDRVGG